MTVNSTYQQPRVLPNQFDDHSHRLFSYDYKFYSGKMLVVSNLNRYNETHLNWWAFYFAHILHKGAQTAVISRYPIPVTRLPVPVRIDNKK